MRHIGIYCIMLLAIISSACSGSEGDYLDINSEWLKKEWILDGRINDRNITSMVPDGMISYWKDEGAESMWLVPCFSVHHYKDGASINPGQLTYGNKTNLMKEKQTDKEIIFRKVEDFTLTKKAIVRFSPGDGVGKYILHVNYEGKDYRLNGYPKN